MPKGSPSVSPRRHRDKAPTCPNLPLSWLEVGAGAVSCSAALPVHRGLGLAHLRDTLGGHQLSEPTLVQHLGETGFAVSREFVRAKH